MVVVVPRSRATCAIGRPDSSAKCVALAQLVAVVLRAGMRTWTLPLCQDRTAWLRGVRQTQPASCIRSAAWAFHAAWNVRYGGLLAPHSWWSGGRSAAVIWAGDRGAGVVPAPMQARTLAAAATSRSAGGAAPWARVG